MSSTGAPFIVVRTLRQALRAACSVLSLAASPTVRQAPPVQHRPTFGARGSTG